MRFGIFSFGFIIGECNAKSKKEARKKFLADSDDVEWETIWPQDEDLKELPIKRLDSTMTSNEKSRVYGRIVLTKTIDKHYQWEIVVFPNKMLLSLYTIKSDRVYDDKKSVVKIVKQVMKDLGIRKLREKRK